MSASWVVTRDRHVWPSTLSFFRTNHNPELSRLLLELESGHRPRSPTISHSEHFLHHQPPSNLAAFSFAFQLFEKFLSLHHSSPRKRSWGVGVVEECWKEWCKCRSLRDYTCLYLFCSCWCSANFKPAHLFCFKKHSFRRPQEKTRCKLPSNQLFQFAKVDNGGWSIR